MRMEMVRPAEGGMNVERLTKRYGSGIVPHKFGIACSVYCDNCSVGSGNCEDAHNMVERLADIEDILGDTYDLDRLRELVEADRNGRCVVFPCRPSDVTVYQLRNKKHARGIGVHPRHIHCATVWADGRYQLEHQGMEPCRDKDLGKKWFLSEEAANAALAKSVKP